MGLKHRIIGAGFAAVRTTGVARLVAPRTQGLGAILMFHHVRPWASRCFAPNRELEITPEFFDGVLQLLRRRGIVIVALDEAIERVKAGRSDRPFVALTFDDGYRDNVEWALPILSREQAPMTLFATTGFIDRAARLWWLEIEEAIHRLDAIEVVVGGQSFKASLANDADKERAAERLLGLLRAAPQDEVDRVASELADEASVDPRALVERLCLDASELSVLATHPLVTIGAHTITHPMLAKVDEARARAELVEAKADLERRIGRAVRHLAYPVGDPGSAAKREFRLAAEAGYSSAVTTRPGMLFPDHGRHLTALPRLSINGRFQSLGDVDLLLTGVPFALWNRGRRLNVA